MKTPIYALAAAAFAVVTTEFSIVGILPAISASLGVSISQAGLFVTLFAFVVAFSGPFLTAFATRFERRALFVSLLAIMAVGNIIAALADNFAVMLVGRLLPAFALPVFWSIASSSAVDIAGPESSGKAISIVFYGVSGATILGMPLGTLIADASHWRVTFAAVAALCIIMALVIFAVFPRTNRQADTSIKKEASTAISSNATSKWGILRDASVIGHLALSGLILTALFTAYTYLADVLQSLGGFNGKETGWILMGFGAIGLLGNWLAGLTIDKHPMKTPVIAAIVAAIGMAMIEPAMTTPALLIIALTLWGVAQSASFVANHVRVVKAVPHASELAASLNVSVYNLGIGLGAVIGGSVIDQAGIDFIDVTGAIILTITLVILGLLRLVANQPIATAPAV